MEASMEVTSDPSDPSPMETEMSQTSDFGAPITQPTSEETLTDVKQTHGSQDPQCIYHSKRWRGEFQCFLNKMRKQGMSGKYINLFPRLVCSCKDLVLREEMVTKDIETLQSSVSSLILPPGGVLLRCKSLMQHFVHLCLTDESRSKYWCVLLGGIIEAMKKNYDVLNRLKSPAKPSAPKPQLESGCTIKLEIEKDDLGLIPFFIGRKGAHLKEIQQSCGCQIQLMKKDVQESLGMNVITIKADSESSAQEAKKQILAALDKIREKREVHARNVRDREKKGRLPTYWRYKK